MTRVPSLQLFYWSHLSYVPVWALLLFHAPNFWKWFLVPGGLFVLEKAVGTAVSRAVGLRIVEVHLLPSQVNGPSLVCTEGPVGWGRAPPALHERHGALHPLPCITALLLPSASVRLGEVFIFSRLYGEVFWGHLAAFRNLNAGSKR